MVPDMKFIVAVMMMGLGLFGAATGRAQAPTLPASKPAVRKEVIAVVEGQLAAFRAGDVGRAFAYAAAGLQLQMPLPRFARLVREGYPEIWANTRAEFGLVRDDGARATLMARVFAKA